MVIKRAYPLLADGLKRVEYASDGGFMIHKVGTDEVYSNAVELAGTIVEYEETDAMIEDTATETMRAKTVILGKEDTEYDYKEIDENTPLPESVEEIGGE